MSFLDCYKELLTECLVSRLASPPARSSPRSRCFYMNLVLMPFLKPVGLPMAQNNEESFWVAHKAVSDLATDCPGPTLCIGPLCSPSSLENLLSFLQEVWPCLASEPLHMPFLCCHSTCLITHMSSSSPWL
jgi:hypothetical protein